jgi:hypothetical protein
LPRAGAVLDRHLYANRVRLFHVPGLSFDPECELIESRTQRLC